MHNEHNLPVSHNYHNLMNSKKEIKLTSAYITGKVSGIIRVFRIQKILEPTGWSRGEWHRGGGGHRRPLRLGCVREPAATTKPRLGAHYPIVNFGEDTCRSLKSECDTLNLVTKMEE